jgi:flagellar FliL protein
MASKKKKEKKAEQDGGDTAEGKAKSGGIVPKAGMLVAMLAVSFGTVYLLPRPDPAPAVDPSAEDGHGAEVEHEMDLEEHTDYFALTPFTISLQGNNRILKIGITLEVVSDEADYMDPSDPKVRDAFTGYLRALRLEQIEDAAFMVQMRSQLLRRAQLILGQENVRGILITDFLVR